MNKTIALIFCLSGLFWLSYGWKSKNGKSQEISEAVVSRNKNSNAKSLPSFIRKNRHISHRKTTNISNENDAEIEELERIFQPVEVVAGLDLKKWGWLADRIKSDPEYAADCISFLKTRTNFEAARALARLIAENCPPSCLVSLRQVAVENLTDADSAKCQIGLMMLSDIPQIQSAEADSNLLSLVANLAQTDSNPQVQLDAILLLQVWLHNSPDNQSQIAEEIIQVIRATPQSAVRTRGYQALAIQGVQFSSRVLLDIAGLLLVEADPKNVALGAETMGMGSEEERKFALDQLGNIYLQASDSRKKLIIGGKMIDLGKGAAFDWLKQIPVNNPLLINQLEARLKKLRP